MKAPKCRICQSEHWANEPHRFGGEIKEERQVPARKVPQRNVTCPACEQHKARIAELETMLATALATKQAPLATAKPNTVVANKRSGDRHKDPEARKAYQRRLMQQRRAAGKS